MLQFYHEMFIWRTGCIQCQNYVTSICKIYILFWRCYVSRDV